MKNEKGKLNVRSILPQNAADRREGGKPVEIASSSGGNTLEDATTVKTMPARKNQLKRSTDNNEEVKGSGPKKSLLAQVIPEDPDCKMSLQGRKEKLRRVFDD
jgi:hypothetical protein